MRARGWVLFASLSLGNLAMALASESVLQFRDVTAQTGIRFRHTDGSSGQYYLVEAMSAGLAAFDYDRDGDVDIYFLNGAAQPGRADRAVADGSNSSAREPANALYRNDGDWKFTEVTQTAGVGDTGHGLGVAIGDYNNDGAPDIYVNNFGPNVLYRNNGDGTFTDVTADAGVANGDRVGAGCSFLDSDRDGDLDLYVANYIKFAYGKHVARTKLGYPIYGSPADYEFDSDTFYQNNGDGTFADISGRAGIHGHRGPSMGMVCADYDRDGDTDVFVANDGEPNFLFENDGSGQFKEVGLVRGFAYDHLGKVHASMGVACGDFDNDGFLDFHVTSFQGEMATLYRNLAGTLLEDVTNITAAGRGTLAPVTWGNGFADFDHDGDRDLFVACGHLYDQLQHFDQSATYQAPNLLLENLGGKRFDLTVPRVGDGMQVQLSTRGAAFEDLDNDGDVDVVLLNSRRRPTLLRNETNANRHWLLVRLQGSRSNRDGIGAQVEIEAGDLKLVDEVHSGQGYQGHHGLRLHFGLAEHERVDRIRVRWIGGDVQTLHDVPADQAITITQQPIRRADPKE